MCGKFGEKNGMYGRTHTDETKRLLSELNKGRASPNKGVPMSKERYAKHMDAMAKRDISGDRNGFYGKRHTKSTRDRIAEARRGKPAPTRKSCSIDGIVYPSYKHASQALDAPIVTIRHRCLSKNPKFKEWVVL